MPIVHNSNVVSNGSLINTEQMFDNNARIRDYDATCDRVFHSRGIFKSINSTVMKKVGGKSNLEDIRQNKESISIFFQAQNGTKNEGGSGTKSEGNGSTKGRAEFLKSD
ncbi:hypothetical protein GYMLUDRAFT_251588 [Collybiopsis luxurians FD-317 M1]|uniref:Uncharacterized protein n=1 Tax=Collybiopsis luxurians FD-317 M1 TaxID=944289 RepID=A0A0D0BC95_9AGAR|nr:hypothetical protein GYMLUDRAFT_251588 [Collybiopsis luxurians FD-317 M1]